ncbi:hypothetical protein jhhlp_001542 [Lomentospora prolificans]|uniref:AAA+ ATPase domain-containing protein n=1 Tax=Lomentospora prolificans TaxID=41688 RepID=A0A2N3NIR1_9PEZI|nr:hypothetical protein jhhlp_001542 [Lomentospora prolificans]
MHATRSRALGVGPSIRRSRRLLSRILQPTRPFHFAASLRAANPGPVGETPATEQPNDDASRGNTKDDAESTLLGEGASSTQASKRPRASHRAALRARQSQKRPTLELPKFRIPQEFLDDNLYIHDHKTRDHPSLFDAVALKEVVDTWSQLLKKSGRTANWQFPKLEEDPRYFIDPKGEYHDAFALVLQHSGWNKEDVEAAVKTGFDGVAERSSLVTLTAALALQGWLLDNPNTKPREQADFAELLERIHASAPITKPEVGLPEDLEDTAVNYSDPEKLLPELKQNLLFYKDLSQAVGADLEARPPKHLSSTDVKRPMNVINISGFSGKRISTLLTRYIASSTGADMIRVGAFELSRLVGGYLGQDWAYSKGPMSMMAFRVAEFNDVLGEPIQWPLKREEDDSDADATVVHLGTEESDGDYKDPLDRELSKIRDNAKDYLLPSVDRWENLKINGALEGIIRAAEAKSKDPRNQKLIIQIDDFVELGMTLEGALLIGRLRNIVDNMWLDGKKIALVGTSSSMELSEKHLTSLREIAMEDSVTICNASRDALGFNLDLYEQLDCLTINMDNAFHMWTTMVGDTASSPTFHSMRLHLHFYHTMLHYLSTTGVVSAKTFAVSGDDYLTSHSDVMEKVLRKLLEMFAEPLRTSILPPTELYHCVRHVLHQNPKPSEVWQAFNLAQWQRDMTIASTNEGLRARVWEPPSHSRSTLSSDASGAADQPRRVAETLGITNDYEKKLLAGLIDKDQIKTTFADVHAPPETISALKLLTSLSLKRPEAFTYGVLARDRIPGCLLYGPPGTGKTLLAKAVAKESGASMLEVSAASINEMWVGQGEKNVQALFSLAKKLEPLVIFIDEADALLASRADNDRRTHRETINQFLREWDGMSDTNAFIMVATNRPFDLDEAVLRRLPRRILVDLPQQADRLAILNILLRGEQLDPSVDLDALSRRTILYSGSDLKNLCVAAAMAAVREETELADKLSAADGSAPAVYPERRTLRADHFDHALKEIGASISDDMKTMREIRRFDETYGKPGKKKKSGMGFGIAKDNEVVKEARVRAP